MACHFAGYTDQHPEIDWTYVPAWPLGWHSYTLTELNEWSAGEGLSGRFAWLRGDGERVVVGFTDPNTAFQFKLRFHRERYGPGS